MTHDHAARMALDPTYRDIYTAVQYLYSPKSASMLTIHQHKDFEIRVQRTFQIAQDLTKVLSTYRRPTSTDRCRLVATAVAAMRRLDAGKAKWVDLITATRDGVQIGRRFFKDGSTEAITLQEKALQD